ncbi:hypothetical protein GCM10023169_29380 [Georgenia halophila]|uniref:Uncharacterized protein n=1 Tax=Georgenia halophila TaxID=620889 RepID=A0ABP8LH75_9MICO
MSNDMRSTAATAFLHSRRRVPVVGGLLTLIGAVHVASTSLVYPEGVASVLDSRVIASIEAEPDVLALRSAVFWYVTAGLLIIVIGALVIWVERFTGHVPRFVAWALLVVTAWGVLLMPVSGFWALLAPVAIALRARPHRPHLPHHEA